MQELSMNILDIAQNAVRAGASLCSITLSESTAENLLRLSIKDNGCGMDAETLQKVCDPFFTSRSTRKVGLGLPFMQMAAEQTGGSMSIESVLGKGTEVKAVFTLGHIDLMPLGDMGASFAALAAGSPQMDFNLCYEKDGQRFQFGTGQAKEILGDVSLSEPAVILFLQEYVNEQMALVAAGGKA